jgi:hypothetical protein
VRRALIATVVAATWFVSSAPSGLAIGNGVPDRNGHPNVGALIVEFEVEPGVFEKTVICSGSLISQDAPDPTVGGVFLTAGHCTDFLPSLGISDVWVSFEPDVDPIPATLLHGTYVTHPGFNPGNLSNDLSVVLLDDPVAGITPVTLPTKGLLDEMKAAGTLRGQTFTNVGYGVVPTQRGRPSSEFDGIRRVSTSPFGGLTRVWLRLLMNSNATGEGGSCFGDSGSPKFVGSSNVIVAVTSWGDAVCRAHNMNWRLDTSSSRDFLDDFVLVP